VTPLPWSPDRQPGSDLIAHDVDTARKVVRPQAQPLTHQLQIIDLEGSHPAQQPKNEKNDENGSKNAATDIHVILLDR
jgi:hypothetical protein